MDRASENAGSTLGSPWLLGLKPLGTGEAPTGGGPGLPPDALGLALSGEGVRGAAFCLGVLQSLARAGWLRHVDYLSTVSGGGYAGAFLGRSFDSYRGRPAEPDLAPGVVQERVARGLIDTDSASVGWLRRHANYLAPSGVKDEALNLSGSLRNLVSVYLALGVLILAAFGTLNAIGYSPFGVWGLGRLADGFAGLLPLCRLLPDACLGPWVVLAEVATWLAVGPLMLAYWLIARDLPGSFASPVLVATAVVAAGTLLSTASPLAAAVLLASVLWSLGAWASTTREEGPADPLHPYRRLLAREHLNRRLASWLGLALALAALGSVDALGRWLARRTLVGGLTSGQVALWLASAAAVVLLLAATLRFAARLIGARAGSGPTYLRALAALVSGVLPVLVVFSYFSQAAYGVGEAYAQGVAVTIAAAVLSLLFGTLECVPLLNQSGTIADLAGRLARTFLGATNTSRRVHPEGQDVTRSVLGDDVPFDRYRPDLAGGPLHLINCALNQTIDVSSFRSSRDRRAENLAVGPAGLSVARPWHAVWRGDEAPVGSLEPLGHEAPDPFLGQRGGPTHAEPLDLEDWMAISGTPPGSVPGLGPRRSSSRAPTFAFARSGYWWDSGLDARERVGTPIKGGLASLVGASLARLLRGQTLLLSELLGEFGGPWARHWYLTNGGDFEGTGAYELLRRRLPFLIVCDACEDPRREGADLARLVRLARIDLGAEVTEVDLGGEAPGRLGVPEAAAQHLGSLGEILTSPGHPARKHATLLSVRYPEPPPGASGDPWLARRFTWVLYLKTTVTGDEPADVRGYAASHPNFPDKVAPDRTFDEPQWESYRKLGEHIGDRLFDPSASGS